MRILIWDSLPLRRGWIKQLSGIRNNKREFMKSEDEIRGILDAHKVTLRMLKEAVKHSIVGFEDADFYNSLAKEYQ